jgi:hypothetical protein
LDDLKEYYYYYSKVEENALNNQLINMKDNHHTIQKTIINKDDDCLTKIDKIRQIKDNLYAKSIILIQKSKNTERYKFDESKLDIIVNILVKQFDNIKVNNEYINNLVIKSYLYIRELADRIRELILFLLKVVS